MTRKSASERRSEERAELHAAIAGYGCWYWILGLAAILATTFIVLWLRPVWLGFERRADVASHQYVEARRTEVLADIQQYDQLGVTVTRHADEPELQAQLERQQQSLRNKIQAALAKIPRDAWPAGAERFAP